MELSEIIAARQEQADRLARLVNEAGAAYRELGNSTLLLGQALFSADTRRQNGARLGNAPVHGLDNLEQRVRDFVEYQLFQTGQGATIRLPEIVANENAAATKFIQDMGV